MKYKSLLWLVSLLLFCDHNPNSIVGPQLNENLLGRWQRYGSCAEGSSVGLNPLFSFWFKPDTFKYYGSALCADSTFEFEQATNGRWNIENESIKLIGTSTKQASISFSKDRDTMYLHNVKYTRALPCYIVPGYCDGMIFRARIGNNFAEAVDSLLKLQPEYSISDLSFDSTRMNNVLDTLWNTYNVPVYSICIINNNMPIHSCGDAIDSLGNRYLLEFCPD